MALGGARAAMLRAAAAPLALPTFPASRGSAEMAKPRPAWRFSLSPSLALALLSRAKNLQGSAKSWHGSDLANDRSLLTRQKDFLHV